MSETREDVRDGYAAAARRVAEHKEQAVDPGCCGSSAEAPGSCCGPTSTVEISAGLYSSIETKEEMLALALENKRKAGAENVEFLKGYIEDIPLPQGTIDVIISNCVINLSLDKPAVFREMHRVLKPGGRIGISDIVAADELSAGDRAERGSYVGCIAGALSFAEYESGLKDAGFTDVQLTKSHDVADGMFSTIVKATKPAG